jgi:hypothetical protein
MFNDKISAQTRALKIGAQAVGALCVGALAMGALAIGTFSNRSARDWSLTNPTT